MKKFQYFLITKSVGLYINIYSLFHPEKAKQLAYKIFSHPRKGKLNKDRLPKTLQKASLEIFQYESENFHAYIWKGSEEKILLVHGWESNASRWKKLLNYLKPLGKTIIAIDAPGHGLSSGNEFNAPKYAEFIHLVAQKYNPKTIIGHSIGGAAITFYLHKYQNNTVEKVVMLGSPSSFKKISDNFISLLSLNSKIKSLLEHYYQERFNIHIDDFAGHLFSINFTQKAFIAHDIHDKVIHIEEGRHYAQSWKDAIYIETEGLGHSLHNSKLYTEIAEFIKS